MQARLRREASSGKGGWVPPRYPWVGVWLVDPWGGVEGPLPFFTWGGGGVPGKKKVAGGPHPRFKPEGGGGGLPDPDEPPSEFSDVNAHPEKGGVGAPSGTLAGGMAC